MLETRERKLATTLGIRESRFDRDHFYVYAHCLFVVYSSPEVLAFLCIHPPTQVGGWVVLRDMLGASAQASSWLLTRSV